MKNSKIIIILVSLVFSTCLYSMKPETGVKSPVTKSQITTWRADCVKSTTAIDMQVNNVRARLKIGGDLWTDAIGRGSYIVPKPATGREPVSALYAGGVWIGGVDEAGNTKLSAVTYSELGYDFFAGPLDINGSTEAQVCQDWDRFFVVKGTNIRNHYNKVKKSILDGVPIDADSIADDVKYWPGKGNPYWREKFKFALPDQNLGAYWDQDGDDIYDPSKGDFPVIDIRGCEPANAEEAKELIPDEMVFWIYNDNGGPQTLSGPTAIQMEIQVQSFAYSTNDEINDMTFYRYKLINKAPGDLRDCYFAMWVDPDLGCSEDDYIGCDVSRSLAYVYNQDAVDGTVGTTCPGGVATYGSKIPIVGMDYFRGPLGPKVILRDSITGDTIFDMDGNLILIDPKPFTGEGDIDVELGMTSFTYNERGVGNPPSQTLDPQSKVDDGFYNVIRGLWRDGSPITYGGNGFNPGSTDTVKYVFPSAPNDKSPDAWSMCSTTLPIGDRRTIQATGPLLLQPSKTNELIMGIVFVPDVDYPCPDITRLRYADDIAQALFDNCFDITDGPDAPDITSVELDRELVLMLSNEVTSNNFAESYEEVDLQAPKGVDSTYKFEGYRIYQLKDAGVTAQELGDISKARPIAQIDVKNKVREIYNWTGSPNPFEPVTGPPIWTPTKMVSGLNSGVTSSIRILEDQFALSDRKLVNHKQYHFLAVAYAYNNWKPFDILEGEGQRRAYLEGRGNVGGPDKRPYTFVPRPIVYDKLNASYGEGAIVTRVSGEGNPGVFLELEDGMSEAMLDPNFNGRIRYKSGFGPVNAKIVNPLLIKDGKYKLEVTGNFITGECGFKDAKWTLFDVGSNKVLLQDRPLSFAKEYILNNLGFSITLSEVDDAGNANARNLGAIDAIASYKDDEGPRWFNGVKDGGIYGKVTLNNETVNLSSQSLDFIRGIKDDPSALLGNMGDGFFVPFNQARYEDSQELPFYLSPAARNVVLMGILNSATAPILRNRDLNNVDIIFTKDKSKWSKCIVVETAIDQLNFGGLKTVGEAKNFELRQSPSVGTDGKPLNDGTVGFSYFPGYAVDVETGERLNIFFGENSILGDSLVKRNQLDGKVPLGSDMIFNPSSQIGINANSVNIMGGQHYIYVTRQKYDEGASLAIKLKKGSSPFVRSKALGSITWTAFPLGVSSAPLLSIDQGLIPNDLVYKLRVNNPYNQTRVYNIEKEKDCTTKADMPVYEFEFTGKQAETLKQEDYVGALANVNVVPNPYYAYSTYETSQFNNTIKITNLPARAIVTIYGIDGSFIKQYNRDERGRQLSGSNRPTSTTQVYPDLDWDMKNFKDIPVASGVYLIHIVAPELGEERTIKWFGIGRKFDPSGL